MKLYNALGRKGFGPVVFMVTLLFTSSHATLDGVFHRAGRGETLWCISRTYRVSVEDVKAANKELAGTNLVRTGQRIFIPGAEKVLSVEPLDRQMLAILRLGWSRRWEYIVIHHSATDAGSARVFELNHRSKGYKALGYHFVICNGTYGTEDGEIEVSARWQRQWDGAHARGNANRVGIGICLVGNFENSRPSTKQMESLVRLATHLAYQHDIPLANIKGHNEFLENQTKCPGRNFPWKEFRKLLGERGIE